MTLTSSKTPTVGSYLFVDGDLISPSLKLCGKIVKVSGSRVYFTHLVRLYAEQEKVYLPLPKALPYDEDKLRGLDYVAVKSVALVVDTYEEVLYAYIESARSVRVFNAIAKKYEQAFKSGFENFPQCLADNTLPAPYQSYEHFLEHYKAVIKPYVDAIVAKEDFWGEERSTAVNVKWDEMDSQLPGKFNPGLFDRVFSIAP